MGEDLCKPCENYLKGEEGVYQENLINKNKSDLDNNDITNSSKLLLYSIKKKPTKLIKKEVISNNNENIKSTVNKTSISKNDDIASQAKVVVDENELNQIIKNYNANLIISSFKKYKQRKEDALHIIQYKVNLKEKRNLIIVEGEEDMDVDLFPEETYNYLGNYFNNKKEGFGIQYFPKSISSYIGYFSDDKRINYCKFEDKSQSYTYQGETKNNFTGKFGIFNNYGKGINYEGEWKDNRKNGIAIETYHDGALYKGEFKNGEKNGIGTYYWKDGSQYEGEWKNNLIEGYGTYKFKDNSFCSGFWVSNQINGFGKFIYPKVKCYLGFFKQDIKNGFGLIFWYDQKKAYIGYWKNNQQNGIGKFISEKNIRYGFWEEGKKVIKYDESEFWNLLNEQKICEIFIEIFRMNYDALKEYVKNFED